MSEFLNFPKLLLSEFKSKYTEKPFSCLLVKGKSEWPYGVQMLRTLESGNQFAYVKFFKTPDLAIEFINNHKEKSHVCVCEMCNK